MYKRTLYSAGRSWTETSSGLSARQESLVYCHRLGLTLQTKVCPAGYLNEDQKQKPFPGSSRCGWSHVCGTEFPRILSAKCKDGSPTEETPVTSRHRQDPEACPSCSYRLGALPGRSGQAQAACDPASSRVSCAWWSCLGKREAETVLGNLVAVGAGAFAQEMWNWPREPISNIISRCQRSP